MFPRSLEIGPVTIHLYGVIIAIAIFAGWYVAKRRAFFYKIPQSIFDDPILLLPLIFGIVGARLYHVLDYWSYYAKNPLSIINIPDGGLGIWGSLVGIFLGFWLVAKVKKLNLLSVLDLVSPSLLLGQAIGRIGNWINQEGFGPPTNLPWGVFISPENRPAEYIIASHFHPTFFYEAILDFILFFLLIYFSSERSESRNYLKNYDSSNGKFSTSSNNKKIGLKPGQTFALYLILYSVGRFAVEFWRIDTATVAGLKVAHLLSVFTMMAACLLFFRKRGV